MAGMKEQVLDKQKSFLPLCRRPARSLRKRTQFGGCPRSLCRPCRGSTAPLHLTHLSASRSLRSRVATKWANFLTGLRYPQFLSLRSQPPKLSVLANDA